jgi:predicted phosphodiesterase
MKKAEQEKLQQIFVLADTHNRLPENVSQLARDADEIWHLGDLCAERILDGLKFRLQHIPPAQAPKDVDAVLHGHTHVPRNERRGTVLFLNPGCVTRPNRGSPASVAWLEILDRKINWRIVPLR